MLNARSGGKLGCCDAQLIDEPSRFQTYAKLKFHSACRSICRATCESDGARQSGAKPAWLLERTGFEIPRPLSAVRPFLRRTLITAPGLSMRSQQANSS